MRASTASSTPRSPVPRTTAGAAICLAPRASAGCAAAAAAAPQGSLKAVFPWLNGHPPRPSARPRAIGKPTRSCLQNTVRSRWPCLSGEHGSSWRPGRAIEPPSVWHSISFGCLPRCRNSCARPSPSTTAASSPAIASYTSSRSAPTSVTRTHPGRRVVSRTQSADCVAFFLARPISRPCRMSISERQSAPTTTPRASALTSGPRPKPSLKCCTSSVNPPPRFRGDERTVLVTGTARRCRSTLAQARRAAAGCPAQARGLRPVPSPTRPDRPWRNARARARACARRCAPDP